MFIHKKTGTPMPVFPPVRRRVLPAGWIFRPSSFRPGEDARHRGAFLMGRVLIAVVCVLYLVFPFPARAGSGHYTSGGEGMRAATIPPPGQYLKTYAMFYRSGHGRVNGHNKNDDQDARVFALAFRPVKVFDAQFLGADIGADAVIPLTYTNIRLGGDAGVQDNRWGLGDILIEPAYLAWHGERWDAVFGPGIYLPTGEFSERGPDSLADPGLGYWTFMAGLGGTYYLDAAKTWSFSLLSRYETHTRQEHTRRTGGDSFHFEWGAGKAFANGFEIGLAGYCDWQVRHNRGGRAGFDDRGLYRAYAAGPEIVYTYAPWGMSFSLRSLQEFQVRNGTEGNLTVFSMTKAF